MDRISPAARSALMSRIRSRDTKPEMAVRRALHRMGFRYRVCCKGLPGRPDIAFPPRMVAVFVHGCFFHSCPCRKGKLPASNCGYWSAKLKRNRERDAEKESALRALGWKVVVVWGCEAMKDPLAAARRVAEAVRSFPPR